MTFPGAPGDPPELHELQWAGFKGAIGWDIGANMGQSVKLMLDRFDRVLAFEPAKESCVHLWGLYREDPRVTVFLFAVSDCVGNVELSERASPIDTGQLVTRGMPYYGEYRGPNTAMWGGEVGVREVPCVSVDALAEQHGMPSFIKVDTEGHEGFVLAGAREVLASPDRPSWLIEFHASVLYDQCVAMLESAGYAVETIRHPHYPDLGPESMFWQHGWIRAIPKSDD
jgi:FkbM family methyltransferase